MTPLVHHWITGGCSASQSSRADSRTIHSCDLGAHRRAPAVGVGLHRQVHDGDRQVARGGVGDRPLAAADHGGQQRRRRQHTGGASARRPPIARAATAIASSTTRGLLDRVDRAAVAPVRVAHLGVAGAARDADDPVLRAAAGDPGAEVGGLGDDPGVGAQPARARAPCRPPPRTPRRCWWPRSGRRPGCIAGRGDRLGGAASSRRPRPSCRRRRARRAGRRGPRGRTGRLVHSDRGSAETTSMWPLSSRLRPAAGAAQGGDELRAPGEVQPLGHQRRARQGGGVGLEQVDLGARRPRRRSARCSCSAASWRGGSPTSRAVVSNAISAEASSTSSCRRPAMASHTLRSTSLRGMVAAP